MLYSLNDATSDRYRLIKLTAFAAVRPYNHNPPKIQRVQLILPHGSTMHDNKPGFNSVENRWNFKVAVLVRMTVTARFARSRRQHVQR